MGLNEMQTEKLIDSRLASSRKVSLKNKELIMTKFSLQSRDTILLDPF